MPRAITAVALLALWWGRPAEASRGSTYRHAVLRGGADDVTVAQMKELLNDPKAVAEAMATLEDPAEMAKVKAMMDDPDFRAQVEAAVAAGGSAELDALRAQMQQTEGLSDRLAEIGPALGVAIEALKGSTDADEFEAASGALLSLVRVSSLAGHHTQLRAGDSSRRPRVRRWATCAKRPASPSTAACD